MYEESKGLVREYEREEIADKLGLTSERVRQLENEAMEEIRREYVSRMGKLK
jgi:DNA-directed RNA polymerase sigma subunit (sigma70/sigma32)